MFPCYYIRLWPNQADKIDYCLPEHHFYSSSSFLLILLLSISYPLSLSLSTLKIHTKTHTHTDTLSLFHENPMKLSRKKIFSISIGLIEFLFTMKISFHDNIELTFSETWKRKKFLVFLLYLEILVGKRLIQLIGMRERERGKFKDNNNVYLL